MSYITPVGMLSFCDPLFEKKPRARGGEPVHSTSLIFNKAAQKTDAYKALEARCMELARELFREKMDDPKFVAKLKASKNWPLKNANEKDYEGYQDEGAIFISPWTKRRPGVVGPDPDVDMFRDDVWPGQLARAEVNPFPYTDPQPGIGMGLNNVQIVKTDMPRIDGRKPANKVFGKVEQVENDDDLPF